MSPKSIFLWVLGSLGMLAVLLWPALWNGFPIVFYDTGGYLARPFEGTLEIGRSAPYGAFLALGIPVDFWLNIVAQAALAGWLVILTLREHGFGGRPLLALTVILTLAVLTSLPWYAAQLMPDVLVSEAVLALYLLMFRSRALRGWEAVLLGAIIAFAMASHMAILGLMLGLLTVVLGLKLFGPRFPRPRLAAAAGSIVAGLALVLFTNLWISGRFAFTPGGASIAFVRLVEDGIVKRYLDDKCPNAAVRLCAYRGELTAVEGHWIWDEQSPINKLGGWQNYEDEARHIILESLTLYPGLHLRSAAAAAMAQFIKVKTGDGLTPWNWYTEWTFERFAPHAFATYRASHQAQRVFDFSWANAIHVPVALLAVALLPLAALLGGRQVRPSGAAFAAFVLLALIGNALISGVFSTANDRYQSRLAWLAVLAIVICALGLRRFPTRPTSRKMERDREIVRPKS